ncbi:787_t:CDS:2, partial [Paraglomus occultum]
LPPNIGGNGIARLNNQSLPPQNSSLQPTPSISLQSTALSQTLSATQTQPPSTIRPTMPPITFQVQLLLLKYSAKACAIVGLLKHRDKKKLNTTEQLTFSFWTAGQNTDQQATFTAQTIPPLAILQLSSNALQTKAHFTPQSELS